MKTRKFFAFVLCLTLFISSFSLTGCELFPWPDGGGDDIFKTEEELADALKNFTITYTYTSGSSADSVTYKFYEGGFAYYITENGKKAGLLKKGSTFYVFDENDLTYFEGGSAEYGSFAQLYKNSFFTSVLAYSAYESLLNKKSDATVAGKSCEVKASISGAKGGPDGYI